MPVTSRFVWGGGEGEEGTAVKVTWVSGTVTALGN